MKTLEKERKTPQNSRQYQNELVLKLSRLFPEAKVIKEWPASKESQDAFKRKYIYSPRLDIAVGPLNTSNRSSDSSREQIFSMHRRHKDFLQSISNASEYSGDSGTNPNPRCFLAIEIENKSTRKHMLGAILNAGALGCAGIVIGWNPKVTTALYRIQNYLEYLWWHKKVSGRLSNAMLIERTKFDRVIARYEHASE